jgi:hypothetical protein
MFDPEFMNGGALRREWIRAFFEQSDTLSHAHATEVFQLKFQILNYAGIRPESVRKRTYVCRCVPLSLW